MEQFNGLSKPVDAFVLLGSNGLINFDLALATFLGARTLFSQRHKIKQSVETETEMNK